MEARVGRSKAFIFEELSVLQKEKSEIDLGEISEWGHSRCSEPFFFINISGHFPLSSMSLQAISTLFLSPGRLWAWPTLLPLLTLSREGSTPGPGFHFGVIFNPSRWQYRNSVHLVPKNGSTADKEEELPQR